MKPATFDHLQPCTLADALTMLAAHAPDARRTPGEITVSAGARPQGQGHETIFTQFAADMWKAPIDDVFVTVADTGHVSQGYGTIASRSTETASGAIKRAADEVHEKVFAIAANMLATAETDIEPRDASVLVNPKLADGQVRGGLVQGLGGALLEELAEDDQASC